MTSLAAVDGFKICIQVCVWLGIRILEIYFFVFTQMSLLFVGFVVVTLTATGIYAFEEEQDQISGNVVIHDVALATQVKTNHWRIFEDAPL